MKSAQLSVYTSRRSRSLSRPIAVWQRVCLSLYTALFAGVLPFICLGALGEPGHPHRFPHFVFAMPAMAEPPATTAGMAQATTFTPRSAHHSTHTSPAHQSAPANTTAAATTNPVPQAGCPLVDGAVPGRATATLVVFAVLQLVLFEGNTVLPWPTPHFAIHRAFACLESITITVPLPPPRLIAQL